MGFIDDMAILGKIFILVSILSIYFCNTIKENAMNVRLIKILFISVSLISILLACSLPGSATETAVPVTPLQEAVL